LETSLCVPPPRLDLPPVSVMADHRVGTPPLSTPAAPRMARDDDDLVADDAYLGLTQSLLSPTEKTSALRSVLAAASRDDAARHGVPSSGHSVGYGPDVDEPFPPQAYANAMETDNQCACFTTPLATTLCILGMPFCCAPLFGTCLTVYPKQAVVTTVFGKFFHAFVTPGLYFVNPCGRDAQVVTLKTTSVELSSVKVADVIGNPLVISGVVSYRVVDPTRAALDIINLPTFVKTNAHATLKRVASLFPYETTATHPPKDFMNSRASKQSENEAAGASMATPGSVHPPQYSECRDETDSVHSSHHPHSRFLSLKTESHLLGDHLREMLQIKMEVCGIKIGSFELSDLSYAAEVAPMMLARQQAAALVDARNTIVDASVGIVDRAAQKLTSLGHQMTSRERVKLVTNMMTVLSGETRPQPTISLSDAEFLPTAE